ncbi:MAG: FHA domain-containing protein [Symploca sp. SIO2C1]|nr:FHA domain-containing protein [Symploca sp. SIO2C1]
MKIKVLNHQTNEFQEKVLTPEIGRQSECLIGRHPSCDLVLNSPEVSRVHGRICCQSGQYYFTDLGSTDGSRMNNEEVLVNQNYLLKMDDVVHIGAFVLIIEEIELKNKGTKDEVTDLETTSANLWHKDNLTVRCLQVIDETDEVKTFRFVAEPPMLFTYQPGQFVTLHLEINGKRVRCSYSISSTPSRPHTLEITVKRIPLTDENTDNLQSLVSNWLHDNIKVGSQIKLSGPLGKINNLATPPQKVLLISAGVGIGPMMSMSRWFCDTSADMDIIFFHSARKPRDIIFRQELELMNGRYPNFKLAVTTSRPESGQAWLGYTGRLNESMLQAIASDLRDRTIYACGSNHFMQRVKAMLEKLEFPLENFYSYQIGVYYPLFATPAKLQDEMQTVLRIREKGDGETGRRGDREIGRWGNGETTAGKDSPQKSKKTPDSPVTSVAKTGETSTVALVASPTEPSSEPMVVFSGSGKEVHCNGEDSILEVAKQAGVGLPHGCQRGVCSKCKLPLLAGEVNYEQEPECEQGYILTCIAKPVGRVVIEEHPGVSRKLSA